MHIFANHTNLLMNTNGNIPFLKQLLMKEIQQLSHGLNELKLTLANLEGVTKVYKRWVEYIGIGLCVFNTGWTAYLQGQVSSLNKNVNQIHFSIGTLQKTAIVHNRQIKTLAKIMDEFQGHVNSDLEILTAIQTISTITQQIYQYRQDLNIGIHSRRIPYNLFDPQEIQDAWNGLKNELKNYSLTPVFSLKPTQLYELNADYFMQNRTFHVLLKIPVKDISQPTFDLHRPANSLIKLHGTLLMYHDQNLLATGNSLLHQPQITITKQEFLDCQQYGSTYCCPKQIFLIHKKH